MKKLIVGGLAALAIGLSGCAAAQGEEIKPPPNKAPIDLAEVVVHPVPQTKTSCVMLVPSQWLCPEGINAPK